MKAIQSQGSLTNKIIQCLKEGINWAQTRQAVLLQQVMKLQRKINSVQSTQHIVRKREAIEMKKEEKKEEIGNDYEKQIEQIIKSSQIGLQSLESKPIVNKAKNVLSMAVKQKKQQPPLPIIEKKPPIPTVNRSKDPHNFIPKPNYHFRNKNEVTGKITETPIMKTNTKISVQPKKEAMSSDKIQKVENPKSISKPQIPKNSVSQDHRKTNNQDKLKQQQPKEEKYYFDFAHFRMSIEELVERSKLKNKQKSQNRKKIREILEKQENDESSKQSIRRERRQMKNFLVACNKLAATRGRLPIKEGEKIEPRCRQVHIQVFNFNNLLNIFDEMISTVKVSEEYNVDPKQIHRIKCWYNNIEQIFEQQIKPIRQSLRLPPKLQINFQMNTNEQVNLQNLQISEEVNPYTSQLYSLLDDQLEQLKKLDKFDKSSLNKLRVLISIILSDGRTSPVLIEQSKFQDWAAYYHNS